uniref:Uncharacterized protein n=1 Tax=Strigamia maritima TaxID=126957 RepID=T1JBI5_STRMM
MELFKVNLCKLGASAQQEYKINGTLLSWKMMRKLMWSAIFFVCLSLICLQVTDRLTYYVNTPLSTNVQVVRNQSMLLPRITICPSDFRRPDIEKQMRENLSKILDRKITSYDLILLENNMTQMWNAFSYKLSDVIKACICGDEPCEKNGIWQPFPSIRGNCFTYFAGGSILGTGSYNGIYLLLQDVVVREPRDPFAWRLLIHSAHDEPLLETFSAGISVYKEFFYDIRLKLKKFQLVNTTMKPCNDISISSCLVNCLKNEIETKIGCSLPFMNSSKTTLCTSPKDFESCDKLIANRIQSVDPSCLCVQECQHDWFETTVDSSPWPTVDSSPWPTGRNATRVRIFYDSFMYEDTRETHLYSLIAMLCDIGGSISLFLGASVFTLLQFVENFIFKIKEKYKPEVKLYN